MQRWVVLFNEDVSLHKAVASFPLRDGDSLRLVYCAPHRPARLKRWVSKSGWERLTLERARKLADGTQRHLAALGCQIEIDAVIGDDGLQQRRHELFNGARCIDARAPRYALVDALPKVPDPQGRLVPVVFKRRIVVAG
jgi:hypothetical protein